MNIMELLLLWDKENEDLNGRRRLRRRFWRILGSANQVKCYIIKTTSKPPDFYSFLFTGSWWRLSHLKTQVIVGATPVIGESPAALCQPGKAMGPNHRWPILFTIVQTILTVWNWKGLIVKLSHTDKKSQFCLGGWVQLTVLNTILWSQKLKFHRWRASPSGSWENSFEKSPPEARRKVSCEEFESKLISFQLYQA